MAIAPLTPLVLPPTQATPAAEWPDDADAYVTDQHRWSVEFNSTTIPAMNAAVDEVNDGVLASAGNVLAARAARDDAQGFAGDAHTARNGAEDAESQAQLYAAAAGAAAGVPALAGNAGKALIVKPDENGMEWGDASQSIGDILLTARDPGPTYLPADGGVYLQSAYPELFAEIGLYGGEPANAWSAIDTGLGANGIGVASDENGVWVMGYQQLARSEDNGLTWSPVSLPAVAAGAGSICISDIATDGLGVWVATSGTGSDGYGHIFRSSDNGETWSKVYDSGASSVTTTPVVSVATDTTGVWMAGRREGGLLRSTDNGLTWSSVTSGSSATILSIATDAAGVWIFTTAGTLTRRSTNNGLTFTTVSTGQTGAGFALATDRAGVWMISGNQNSVRSLDNGVTWSAMNSLGSANYTLATNRKGVWVSDTKRSLNNGVTWITATGKTGPNTTLYTRLASDGDQVFIHRAQRGTPSYEFDPLTQFRVPDIDLDSFGVANSYIKAMEVA